MARKRMIDPTIWEDEDFGKLTLGAKLLFIGLFSNADDEGRIRANVAYLKSTIFMYEDIALEDVKAVREQVCEIMKSVKLYEISGKEYIQLSHWNEYQKQHKDRIQPSTLPPYQEHVSDIVRQSPHKLSKVRLDKDKLSKVSIATSVAVADPINDLIAQFKSVNPNYERLYPNKTQREALQRMVDKHTKEKISRAIDCLKETNTKAYAPRITTPLQLEEKMGALIAFLNQDKNKTPSIAVMPQEI